MTIALSYCVVRRARLLENSFRLATDLGSSRHDSLSKKPPSVVFLFSGYCWLYRNLDSS